MKKKNEIEIKTVIFDMGNVLLKFNAYIAAKRFAKHCGVPLTHVWAHFFTSKIEKAYTRGEISTYAFFNHAKKSLKLPVKYSVFRHYWNDIFWENEGMDALLKKLKKKYPLYVISNTNAMHFNHVCKNYKILKHFKRLFPSHLVGYRKPDRKIYEKVLKKIRYRPEETVFVDDVKSFVDGAKNVGMNAIHFKNAKQLTRELKKYHIHL